MIGLLNNIIHPFLQVLGEVLTAGNRAAQTSFAVRIYGLVGYNWCVSVQPTNAHFESFSVTDEQEYTAHGMWVMAELVAKATASFIADSNVTSNSSEVGVSAMSFQMRVPTAAR